MCGTFGGSFELGTCWICWFPSTSTWIHAGSTRAVTQCTCFPVVTRDRRAPQKSTREANGFLARLQDCQIGELSAKTGKTEAALAVERICRRPKLANQKSHMLGFGFVAARPANRRHWGQPLEGENFCDASDGGSDACCHL